MTFPVDDIVLGPRSFGIRPQITGYPIGVSAAGIIWHTTEYANFSRAEALRCAQDQARRTPTGGWAQPGSYNFQIYDGGVMLNVPYLEASGGINPSSPAWAPERFPWLKALLGAAYSDPTMSHLQIAFTGKTADIIAGRMPANMWESAVRLAKWFEASTWGHNNGIFSGHFHWQSNRSDPGQGTIDEIIRRMSAVTPVPPPDYKALYEAEVIKATGLAKRVSTIKQKVAANASDIADD